MFCSVSLSNGGQAAAAAETTETQEPLYWPLTRGTHEDRAHSLTIDVYRPLRSIGLVSVEDNRASETSGGSVDSVCSQVCVHMSVACLTGHLCTLLIKEDTFPFRQT